MSIKALATLNAKVNEVLRKIVNLGNDSTGSIARDTARADLANPKVNPMTGIQTEVPDAGGGRYKVTRLKTPKHGNQINGRGVDAYLDYAMHDLHMSSKAAREKWNRDKEPGEILYENALLAFMEERYPNMTISEAIESMNNGF